ncbi:MAG: hypothetical protein Q7S72_01105 [Candidatus Taylorbacteria bacterium]|nr:hypothetical protein [Candidatus Taylorbacteria bacterium]
MNKSILILVIIVVIGSIIYFLFTKNNIREAQSTTTVNSPQNMQEKVSSQVTTPEVTKSGSSNSGVIPQPPKLPE